MGKKPGWYCIFWTSVESKRSIQRWENVVRKRILFAHLGKPYNTGKVCSKCAGCWQMIPSGAISRMRLVENQWLQAEQFDTIHNIEWRRQPPPLVTRKPPFYLTLVRLLRMAVIWRWDKLWWNTVQFWRVEIQTEASVFTACQNLSWLWRFPNLLTACL